MKISSISLSLFVTSLSLASAFVPRNPHQVPASPTRSVSLFAKQELLVKSSFGTAKQNLDTLNSGSEDDSITDNQLDLLKNVLETIQGKDATKEITDEVLSKSDVDAEDKVDVVTELESPNRFTAPKALARELPENQVQTEVQQPNAVAGPLLKVVNVLRESRIKDKEDMMSYDTYKPHPEFPDVPLDSMMKMMKGVPPREYFFSGKKFARIIVRVLRLVVGLQLTSDDVEKASTYEDKFLALFTKKKIGFLPNPFNLVPKPAHIVDQWDDDKEFARQFLQGTNPVMISVVNDVKKQLTNPLIRFFKDDKSVDLEALAEQKRLFYVSYDDLADLKVNPHQATPAANNPGAPQDNPRYFDAPIIVFQLSPNRHELQILAIQLDRTKDAEVFTATTTDETTWLMAKSSVANADSQMHEWVSHLGMTHLTMEPHLVAIHNTLKKNNHKVYDFVKPMMRDTLFLGWAARLTLADYGTESFGDRMTSVGTGQFMQLIKKYWSRYSFFESSGLPNELAKRGFDETIDIPGYLYREDGLKLWSAYEKFAQNFVDKIYGSDEEVATDAGLQEWADETTKKAAVPGFPKKFTDKDMLARTLTTLGWICSGLHAGVNFPQYDCYSFQPNKPIGFRSNMEIFAEKSNGKRDWIFQKAYHELDDSKEAMQTARVLTLPSKHCLVDLKADFRGTPAYGPYKLFKKDLKSLGKIINKRNAEAEKNGKPVYPYLHPSVVPASIDI